MNREDVKVGQVVKCTNKNNGATLVGRVREILDYTPEPGVPHQPVRVDFTATEGPGDIADWGYDEIEPTDLPLGTATPPRDEVAS